MLLRAVNLVFAYSARVGIPHTPVTLGAALPQACHPEVQDAVFAELAAAGLASSSSSSHTADSDSNDGSNDGSHGSNDRGSNDGPGSSSAAPRDFEPSDLGRLPLLSAVIKESLRLCPPGPFGGSRLVTDDNTKLCGYDVPKVKG